MKQVIPVAVALVATFSASLSCNVKAGDEINESRDVSATGLVEIINPRGEVAVIGWDENRVEVEGELDDLVEEFNFEVKGESTRVEVVIPRRSANWGDGSDLKIHVPMGSRVSFEGVSSDASFRHITGGLKARSASGDFEASGIASQLNLTSVSGDIEAEDSSGIARLSTVSGEIEVDISSEKVVLDTVSGDVVARLGDVARLHATVVSGDIEVRGHVLGEADIEISSVSGDMELDLVSPVDARISVETGPGGDITNNLTDDSVRSKFPAMNGLDTTVGKGTGSIRLRTVSGDIELDGVD